MIFVPKAVVECNEGEKSAKCMLDVGYFLSALGWVRGGGFNEGARGADATRKLNRSDELTKRERLTCRLRAVAPWCVNRNDR